MELTAALAADLAVLSEALDETDADILATLRRLTAATRLAVPSYLGLTAVARNSTFPLTLTAMERTARPDDVLGSLLIPLTDHARDGPASQLVVIFYAARPGAFVDLAADLSWLTGRRLSDFVLDQHLSLSAEAHSPGEAVTASVINQAIGVLVGRGYTPEQAAREIEARATATAHSRMDTANTILGALRFGDR